MRNHKIPSTVKCDRNVKYCCWVFTLQRRCVLTVDLLCADYRVDNRGVMCWQQCCGLTTVGLCIDCWVLCWLQCGVDFRDDVCWFQCTEVLCVDSRGAVFCTEVLCVDCGGVVYQLEKCCVLITKVLCVDYKRFVWTAEMCVERGVVCWLTEVSCVDYNVVWSPE